MDKEQSFEELLRATLPPKKEDVLRFIGDLVNLADDLGREAGLLLAINLVMKAEHRFRTSTYRPFLYYFCGNAYSGLRKIHLSSRVDTFHWEIPDAEKEVFYFRKALLAASEMKAPPTLRCQIMTNLANALNHIGRFVECNEYYYRALAIDPNFAMARGNLGYSSFHYGISLYDTGQKATILKRAYQEMTKSMTGKLENGAAPFFKRFIDEIARRYKGDFLDAPFSFREFSLGRSKSEQQYRTWCLKRHLFLNPLNDFFEQSAMAQDILSTPSIVVPLGDGMFFQGMFNQLAQEYVSARYLLYEALHSPKPHFSDKNVLLINTLDYPAYGFVIERLRLSFRMSYSILDKVAFFINRYFEIGEKQNKVEFRSLWYVDRDRKKGLKTIISKKKNWPLRGLYWLSRDLYTRNTDTISTLEPEARDIADIRNQLEHKFLVMHEMMYSSKNAGNEKTPFKVIDPLVAHYSRREVEDKALKLLKLARAALIYLSLAIHWEEIECRKASSRDNVIPGLAMTTYEDAWKR